MTNNRVRIVTDSACDLPISVCEDLGITVVPLSIRFGEQEYTDRVELTNEQFWTKLVAADTLPETAAPSVGAFEEAFRRLAAEGAAGVICISLSSKMSATMQSAQVAAKALDQLCPIEIIDSKSASMGVGSLAQFAARLANAGQGMAEISDQVRDMRERTGLLATVDTLQYLRKSGRVSSGAAMLGSVLAIKPIIGVDDGAVVAAGKVRTRSKSLQFLADHVKSLNIESLAVIHASAPDLEDFLDMLAVSVPRDQIAIGSIGPVIGVHTGPGTMGIIWTERA